MARRLVIGATGILGGEVARRLRSEGHDVRALARRSSDPSKVGALRDAGVDVVIGDLKDPPSLEAAFHGVTHVISTASSTLSRAEGDTIDSVDRAGQINAIQAARAARVEHFVLVSFPQSEITFPLQDAKRAVEDALRHSGLSYTILQAPHVWEVWCSPPLGFDAQARKARIFGEGRGKMSWVSFLDVASVAIKALDHAASRNKTFTFGGPEPLSQLDIVEVFEEVSGPFVREHVPYEALRAQYEGATDPLQRSFVALMLICASGGWVFDNTPVRNAFHVEFSSIRDLARHVQVERE